MDSLISLIREYPWGCFIFGIAILITIEQIVIHITNKNRPIVECECECHDNEDEEED